MITRNKPKRILTVEPSCLVSQKVNFTFRALECPLFTPDEMVIVTHLLLPKT
jgi:hypothetical protein